MAVRRAVKAGRIPKDIFIHMKHVWEILNSENCKIEWENEERRMEILNEVAKHRQPLSFATCHPNYCHLFGASNEGYCLSQMYNNIFKYSGLDKSLNYFCLWFVRKMFDKHNEWNTQSRLPLFTALNDLHGAYGSFFFSFISCAVARSLCSFNFIFLDVPLPCGPMKVEAWCIRNGVQFFLSIFIWVCSVLQFFQWW